MEAQSFFAGQLTHICMLNLSHRFISALDQPHANDISHIIIFDSHYRPLSLLNINCNSCLIALEDQAVRRLFAESLDAGDMPFRGPPPKYEIDMLLPDYHQQDQEQTDTDGQRRRMPSAQERGQAPPTHRRSVFRENFYEEPSQGRPGDTLIDRTESDTSDETLIDTVESEDPSQQTSVNILIDITESDSSDDDLIDTV